MTKRILLTLALVAFAAAAFAAEKTAVSGVLIDKMCSAENKTEEKALKHGKDCAEMEHCAKSGFGVLTKEGKFLTFDAAGNKKAEAFLKSFKGDDAIRVKVDGEVEGSSIKVASISGAAKDSK
ncbi:MAG: hypothetical protein ACREUU_11005 [Gammaproteobacteria bacterium]